MTSVSVHPPRNRTDLREAILAVSEKIGSELGQGGLTMRNIAAAIGVSPTILYQHFDNKAAILRELEVHGYAELEAQLDAVASSTPDPVDGLCGLCACYLEFARRNPWLYSLLFGGVPLDAQGRADALASRAAHCLAATRRLRTDLDPTIAGLQTWAAMHGLALAVLGGAIPNGDVEARIDSYVRTILSGVAA